MEQVSRGAVIPRRIDSTIRFFLYVLIFWLPYSPAVVEICVIISLLLWVSKRMILRGLVWRREDLLFRQKIVEYLKGFKPARTPLNKPIAFFLIVCVLSVISSHFFENAAHNFFTKTLEWFIVYFLVIEVFQEKKHIVIVLGIWVFTAFSTIIDSFIQVYFTHKDIFLGHIIGPDGRATAGFKTSNGLGAYLSLVIPFLLSLLFLSLKKGWCFFIGLLIFCLSFWSLIITASRGAGLGVGIGIAFFIYILLMQKIKVKRFSILLLLIFLSFSGICILLVLGGHIDAGFFIRNETAQWRLNVWQDTLKMIKDRPLLGHGINTYMALFETYRRDFGTNPTYAHNCYLQLTAETGIAGLLGFLWIIGRFFRHSFRSLRVSVKNNKDFMILSAGLLSGIMSFLVHSFFDTNFYSLQLSIYLWFTIGIMVSLNKVCINPLRN